MADGTRTKQTELAASLTRLGIRELEERMEISPLLLLGGDDAVTQSDTICCTCKIPVDPDISRDGMIPYPQIQENLLNSIIPPRYPF